ncbi:MAG: aminoglycoside 6-adenylyltransferase [Lachnospiraceae bacterium]
MKRTDDEMMQLIMEKAETDERIRAVTLNGSRANENAVHDKYSDFDTCNEFR